MLLLILAALALGSANAAGASALALSPGEAAQAASLAPRAAQVGSGEPLARS